MTTMSHTFKKAYAKLLLPFEIVRPLLLSLFLSCIGIVPICCALGIVGPSLSLCVRGAELQ